MLFGNGFCLLSNQDTMLCCFLALGRVRCRIIAHRLTQAYLTSPLRALIRWRKYRKRPRFFFSLACAHLRKLCASRSTARARCCATSSDPDRARCGSRAIFMLLTVRLRRARHDADHTRLGGARVRAPHRLPIPRRICLFKLKTYCAMTEFEALPPRTNN